MFCYATKMVEAVEQSKAGKKYLLLCLVFLMKKIRAVENYFLKELMFGVDDYAEELYKQYRCISKT